MTVVIRTVADDDGDIRLDRWFRRQYPALTQGVLQKMCRTGQVRVDGHRVETSTRLAAGQSVRVPPLPAPIPAAERAARQVVHVDAAMRRELEGRVLYRDSHLLLIDKPAGLAVQGGPGITEHLDGMLDALRFEADRPRLVHRLDRDTSGVMVLARTATAAAKLSAAFRSRDAEKTYWAVVAGRPVPVEGRIDLPLKRETSPRGEKTVTAARDDPDGSRAVTDYRTLDNAAQKLAWLELQPRTGRTHQLRVHCVALDAPILGDEKYHRPDQNNAFSAFIHGLPDQLHLHARHLRLPHPAGGWVEAEADLPPHMRETFDTLGFAADPARPARRTP